MFNAYENYTIAGHYSVKDTTRLLARYHYIEAQMMRVLAGSMARLPEWEVKCMVGRHLWQDARHADNLLDRMQDLRWPRKAPLHPGEPTLKLMALLDQYPHSAALLVAVYRVIKPRLVGAYTAHLGHIRDVCDEPTQFVLRHLIADEQTHIAEGEALLGSLLPRYDYDTVIAWQQRIEQAFMPLGGLAIPSNDIEREIPSHFDGQSIQPAPAIAARDERFRVVTGQFSEPPPLPDTPTFDKYMAHRDADNEMHAAEVLGRNLYENPDMPWAYFVDMARQCWDEVRHAVLYQKYLEQLGGHLGQYPSVPGNYAYRMQLDFPHRLYDLHLRGEKLGMPDLIRYREQAYTNGNITYALLNDFVHADEVPHVKNGRWLKHYLADDEDAFQQVKRETMALRHEYESQNTNDPLLARYTSVDDRVLQQGND